MVPSLNSKFRRLCVVCSPNYGSVREACPFARQQPGGAPIAVDVGADGVKRVYHASSATEEDLRILRRFYAAIVLWWLVYEGTLPAASARFSVAPGVLEKLRKDAYMFAGMRGALRHCVVSHEGRGAAHPDH